MANIINMALVRQRQQKALKEKKPVNLDGPKFFTKSEIKVLRKHLREKAESALFNKRKTAVREWLLIDLLTSTGLRASEVCNLRIRDLGIGYGKSEIVVRSGKGNTCATIQIPSSLKSHIKQFLKWKKRTGEPVDEDAFLVLGQRGKMTRQGVNQIIKKNLKALGLYEPGKAVHALRHSYAVNVYQRSKDLRLVQKQLRHKNIQTTTVYADVTSEEIQEQIKGLWS